MSKRFLLDKHTRVASVCVQLEFDQVFKVGCWQKKWSVFLIRSIDQRPKFYRLALSSDQHVRPCTTCLRYKTVFDTSWHCLSLQVADEARCKVLGAVTEALLPISTRTQNLAATSTLPQLEEGNHEHMELVGAHISFCLYSY